MNNSTAPIGPHPLSTLDDVLALICSCSPVIAQTLSRHGHQSVQQFLATFQPSTVRPYQDVTGVAEVLASYVEPLLGRSIARAVSRDLRECPMVLTANHHGVDYFAQSVQGTLLFSRCGGLERNSATTIPVFAFGNIPLNNITYPRGQLLYGVTADFLEQTPVKVPLFPDKYKHAMVSTAQPFTQPMVAHAQRNLRTLMRSKKIDVELAEAADSWLQDGHLREEILALQSYSDQSVVLNHLLWRRLNKCSDGKDLVYVEIEKLVSELLIIDLDDPCSLVSRLLLDPVALGNLIVELQGVAGCWRHEAPEPSVRAGDSRLRSGTVLFWGVDESGGRTPLDIVEEHDGRLVLSGASCGAKWYLPVDKSPISQALRSRRLIPSLFTCFLVVCFARGITCLGGYYQARYLPMMRSGLLSALNKTPQLSDLMPFIEAIPTEAYLSGMQTMTTRVGSDYLVPAGPLEMIAGGGLEEADIQAILSLTVRDAHIASMLETVGDIVPKEQLTADWKIRLAKHNLAQSRHLVMA